MPPAAKSLAALAAAVAMVVAAVFGRSALDTKKVNDDLRLTVVCDPPSADFCRAAAGADSRLTIRVESPDRTTKALTTLQPGQAPDFQAWVSVGPWLQMTDGRRTGQPPLQRAVRTVAATPIVLVSRPGQALACGPRPPAACLPLTGTRVGLTSPRTSGIGLAGVAQVVLASTPVAARDLDRGSIESGPAAPVLDRLARSTNPSAGLEQLNIGFSQANPLVTTQAAANPVGGRAQVVRSEPAVQAVLQVGILDARATSPLGGEAAGQALARAATSAGWEVAADPTGGLPEPGVLAALQDAWTGPA